MVRKNLFIISICLYTPRQRCAHKLDIKRKSKGKFKKKKKVKCKKRRKPALKVSTRSCPK